MSCQQCERYLVYYLLGELSPRDRQRMERHIPNCVTCSDEMKVLARDLNLISEAIGTAASAPDALMPAVRMRIAQEPPLQPARRSWLSTRLRPAQAFGAAVVVVAVSLLTWFVWKPEIGAAPITYPALMGDRQDFLANCGIDGLTRATPEAAAHTLTDHAGTEVVPPKIPCDGLQFLGYACRKVKDCPVALLVYGADARDGTKWVAVYEYAHSRCALKNELAEVDYHGKSYHVRSTAGTTTVAWQRDKTTIALVSKCSRDDALVQAEAARTSVSELSPSSPDRI